MSRTKKGLDAPEAPLHGLFVVDLSRVLAGPLCTQMLGDHGARVIKVEPPQGDETRELGPPYDAAGHATYYSATNRNKEAITLDLKLPQAREVLRRLLDKADVLVENFLPGTMQRWDLDYEAHLAARYPRLVYCSITGFGADGPLGGMPGYDAVLQAMCGLMSVNGDPRSGATRMGIPVVDHLTAYVALSGILMALRMREQTGRGQHVEATLFDTGLSLLVPHAANWLASGKAPSLLGSGHPNISPYDKFAVSDGEIFLGIVNDGQFRRFCAHIGEPALGRDPRFETNPLRLQNRATLRTELEHVLRRFSAAALCRDLMQIGVPAGVVHSVPEALSQPHAEHRASLVEQGGYHGVRSPIRLADAPEAALTPPPAFAGNSGELLHELGYATDEIEDLRASGAAPKTITRNPPRS